MTERVQFAQFQVTSKDLAPSTVRLQPGSFQRPGSYSNVRTNVRERRMTVTFSPTANAPTVIYHGLGFVPSAATPLGQLAAGTIYQDFPMQATSRVVVLKATVANLVADVLIR